MVLGWIDFSRNERNKVLNVLESLSEKGTLDELGIAVIRDGYSDLFFPGTSTIQTRAKYFFLVPYAFKDLEKSNITDQEKLLEKLDETEQDCGNKLYNHDKTTNGIIGKRALANNKWVKRTPSDIYWAGLRNYGILTDKHSTISGYARKICEINKQLADKKIMTNRSIQNSDETDDRDAGHFYHKQIWNIPTYQKDWNQSPVITLSQEEGRFLKERIIDSNPDSMLAAILKDEKLHQIIYSDEFSTFEDIKGLIHRFSEQIQFHWHNAIAFSNFMYIIYIVYNLIISDNKNNEARKSIDLNDGIIPSELRQYAETVNLQNIFATPEINKRTLTIKLRNFLNTAKKLISEGNLKDLEKLIIDREKSLKDKRAKTSHIGEFDPQNWYGGSKLDYRFSNAKIIIKDILDSEDLK